MATLGDLAIGSDVGVFVDGVEYAFKVVHHGAPSTDYSASFNDGTILMIDSLYSKIRWGSFALANPSANDYANSEINSYLNNDFYNSLSDEIKGIIKNVKIPYRPGGGSSTTVNKGEDGLPVYCWLGSLNEVGTTHSIAVGNIGSILSYFVGKSNIDRVGIFNGTANPWWLRNPAVQSGVNYYAMMINQNGGGFIGDPTNSDYCIRPFICLPQTSLISDQPNENGNYEFIWATEEHIDVEMLVTTKDTMPKSIKVVVPLFDFSTAQSQIWEVCNNYLDETKAWEPFTYGEGHVFVNQTKTASQWAVGLRIMALDGEVGSLSLGEPFPIVEVES